ncbi:Rbl2p [Sporobolomyces salmoneus]|uniref:Rbl2p n=1 Tax=Sporobolomyces salmoneus TaxID=183962 RepID=UPI003179426F
MSNAARQLSIKTGVVNRLVKEVASYKTEAEAAKATADKMEAEEEDEYEVKQARRVQADSLQMIPDSEKRLAKAIEDLEELVMSAEDEISSTEEFKKAEAALKAAKPE